MNGASSGEDLDEPIRSRTGTGLPDASGAGVDYFRRLYQGTRLLALSQPLNDGEQEMLPQIARGMERALGLAPVEAARQAMRLVFSCRDEWLHCELLLEQPAAGMAHLLASVNVEGLDNWPGASAPPDGPAAPGPGCILTCLHYSLYSSLLGLWLCRATALPLIRRLTILIVPDHPRHGERLRRQIAALAAAGLAAADAITILERDRAGGLSGRVLRDLLDRLRAGETVFVATDPDLLAPTMKHAVVVHLGRQPIALPGGVAWLARMTGCPVVPLAIRPRGDADYVLTIYPPGGGQQPGGTARTVQAALQHLLDQTVLVDPAYWEGWLWLPGGAADLPEDRGRDDRAFLPRQDPLSQLT